MRKPERNTEIKRCSERRYADRIERERHREIKRLRATEIERYRERETYRQDRERKKYRER